MNGEGSGADGGSREIGISVARGDNGEEAKVVERIVRSS